MAALRTLLLLGLLLKALGLRAAQRQRPPPSPLEKVVAQEGLSLPQLSGEWFLVGMASHCSNLAEQNHQLEATTVMVTILDGQSLAISTFRKLDRVCWEIRQHYLPAQTPGRFLLKGHRKSSKVDVVVGEADPSSFVILYYQKGHSISVKLYGRTSLVSDAIVDKFEQHVRAVGLSEDVTYYFPTYGFCDAADEFHILDGVSEDWSGTGGPYQTTPQNGVCALVWQTLTQDGHQKRSCRCRWRCQGVPELSPHVSQLLPVASQV